MVGLKKIIFTEIDEKTQGMSRDELLDYLAANNLIDQRIGEIALIRKRFFNYLKEMEFANREDVKAVIEDELGVSTRKIEACIYKHKKVNCF